MKFDIVFVHGTGVREPGYSKTFSIVQQKLGERSKNLRFHKCYWGKHGSTLNAGGLSLPKFDEKKSLADDLNDDDYYLGLWELLYQDPLMELQILAIGSNTSKVALGATPGHDLDLKFRNWKISDELGSMLKEANIEEFFTQAQKAIVKEQDYRDGIASAKEPLDEYRIALARALVAQSSILLTDKYGEYALSLNGKLRDEIVNQIVAELGSKDTKKKDPKKGLVSGARKRISGIIRRFLQSRRRRFSEDYSGTLGDILMYQARGQELRDFVRQTIEPLEGKTVVIAHSLGGIICVDLLLEKEPPKIDFLITIGSQSPVLYELNALVGMEYNPNAQLPATFRKWLNIYDPNDFLSYIGKQIFPDTIVDFEVNSNQSFPQSHGAYWNNEKMWDRIWQEMEELAND